MEGQFCVTSLSLQTVFYMAEAGFKKDTIFVQNQQNNFSVIRQNLLIRAGSYAKIFKIVPVTADDCNWALENYNQNDFEDALQIGCCIHNDINLFVTADQNLTKKYSRLQKIKLVS